MPPKSAATVTLLRTSDAAKELGCAKSTVLRVARSLGLQESAPGVWLFSPRDIDRLRAAIRPGPGNPGAVEGNRYFGSEKMKNAKNA